jgi:hypothetical protein
MSVYLTAIEKLEGQGRWECRQALPLREKHMWNHTCYSMHVSETLSHHSHQPYFLPSRNMKCHSFNTWNTPEPHRVISENMSCYLFLCCDNSPTCQELHEKMVRACGLWGSECWTILDGSFFFRGGSGSVVWIQGLCTCYTSVLLLESHLLPFSLWLIFR